MSKIHLRRGKTGYLPCFSACSLATSNRGRRSSFHNSLNVSPAGFKATPPEERCKACEQIFIKRRNEQRKKKGLAPVQSIS